MSIWQTHSWKNLLISSHQADEVFEVEWVFIEKRRIWLGKFWLFSLWVESSQAINEEKIIQLTQEQKCLFVQIETFWVENNISLSLKNFQKWSYKKFITPYTALINLSKTEEEILANMKPKWRYNIKLASKKWVEVFEAEKTKENIRIFYDLMLETTSRDHFSGNTFEYYQAFLDKIIDSELIFTKYEDKIISAWIFIFNSEVSIYYYWASTSNKQYRNLMAPYWMQWFAIQKAKKIGSKYYDFLWVASPWEINSHLSWVTDFKLKFTPDIQEVSKSYLYISSPLKYKLFCLLKKIKSLF